MGTPPFAVPTLQALVQAGHQVRAVYTQPDRPQGRGQQLAQSAVKQAALALGLPVRQPERVRRPEEVAELAALQPECIIVVGYGQILPQTIIDIPRLGILNVHASLLPKYRGAAPIQWAIADGQTTTGVTIMQIDAGLDTGPMLLRAETPIGEQETAPELAERLAQMGAQLCVQAIAGLAAGTLSAVPQNQQEATLARILEKEDGRIHPQQTATQIHCRLRGFTPWPGAYCLFRNQPLKIHKARPAGQLPSDQALPPGTLYAEGKRLLLACGQGTILEIFELQQEGRKRVDAASFLNGQRITREEIS